MFSQINSYKIEKDLKQDRSSLPEGYAFSSNLNRVYYINSNRDFCYYDIQNREYHVVNNNNLNNIFKIKSIAAYILTPIFMYADGNLVRVIYYRQYRNSKKDPVYGGWFLLTYNPSANDYSTGAVSSQISSDRNNNYFFPFMYHNIKDKLFILCAYNVSENIITYNEYHYTTGVWGTPYNRQATLNEYTPFFSVSYDGLNYYSNEVNEFRTWKTRTLHDPLVNPINPNPSLLNSFNTDGDGYIWRSNFYNITEYNGVSTRLFKPTIYSPIFVEKNLYLITKSGVSTFNEEGVKIGSQTIDTFSSYNIESAYPKMLYDYNKIFMFTPDYIISFVYFDEYGRNTYEIRNNDGEVLYVSLSNAPNLYKVRFDIVGAEQQVVNYTFTSIDETIRGQYYPQVPIGYTIRGFSNVVGNQNYLYKVNTDENVVITNNYTFYEVYGVDSSYNKDEVYLFQNSADSNTVDKTSKLKSIGKISGVIRNKTSITNLILTIEYNGVPNFNYVYIPLFNRYYFVSDFSSVKFNLWELDLNVDVLMSYKDGIYNLRCFIDRCENVYNDLIPDDYVVSENDYIVTEKKLGNSIFNGQSYILTGVNLGGKNE